ncbi:hypothetical protein V6N13_058996 [Hibiscus sabdariffa]
MVTMLKHKDGNFPPFTTLPHVYLLLSRDWIMTIDHIERSQNKTVDLLAKRAYDSVGHLHVYMYMDPPDLVRDCVHEELSMVIVGSVNLHLITGFDGLVYAGGVSNSGVG